MAAKVVSLFSNPTIRNRVLASSSSLSTGAGAPGHMLLSSAFAPASPAPSPPGAATFTDAGITPSDFGDAPSGDTPTSSDGPLAKASAFVAQNKTAFLVAGGVGVVAVGAALYLAFRKG